MSGSGGSRSDAFAGSATSRIGGTSEGESSSDPCSKIRRGPINSPKLTVVSGLTIGSVLDVQVIPVGQTVALVVKDANGQVAGSLTFVGYLELIDCIQTRGFQYRASVISIAGGVYEVRVEPV